MKIQFSLIRIGFTLKNNVTSKGQFEEQLSFATCLKSKKNLLSLDVTIVEFFNIIEIGPPCTYNMH